LNDATSLNGEASPNVWHGRPWGLWVGLLAVLASAVLLAGALVLNPVDQTRVAQFMIPPYSYTCLGLAVIALTELRDGLGRRICMAVVLAVMAPLSVLSYAVGGVGPMLVLGTHVGCIIAWVAWRRRFGWTLFWLLESLLWVGIAAWQGRLIR
jgi:hypothetical protein